MVFIEIGSVMMLTTCHTATTWMLAVLAYTTMTSGNMAPAIEGVSMGRLKYRMTRENSSEGGDGSHCLRVLLNRVGMTAIEEEVVIDFLVVVVIIDCGIEVRDVALVRLAARLMRKPYAP